MSLIAAIAKGLGAGTVANANQGFDKIKRDQEAAERAALTDQEYNRRDSQIAAQLKAGREETDARIAANREDTNARLAAQSEENAKQRAHDLDMFQRRLAVELQAANASANAKGRETYAKNLMSSLDAINKRMAEVEQLGEDKISPEQRAKTMTGLKFAGAMITADPNAQQMLNEHGGGGYVTYFQSFVPDVSPQGEGGGEAPPPQATTAPPRPGSAGGGSAAPDGRPAYAKGGYGGLIPHIQQGGERAAEAAVINQMLSAPVLNRNASQTPQAADAYQRMYQR
ncbi:hypothetical protein ACB295_02730 [Aeromonas caviae]